MWSIIRDLSLLEITISIFRKHLEHTLRNFRYVFSSQYVFNVVVCSNSMLFVEKPFSEVEMWDFEQEKWCEAENVLAAGCRTKDLFSQSRLL